MNKNKGKRLKRSFRIFIVVMTFVIFILFCLFLLGAYVFKSSIDTVVVYNNKIVSDEEIIKLAELDDHPNFYLTSRNQIEKRIKKNIVIKDVKVKKKLFFEIDIYIDEYKPLFYREDIKKVVLNNGEEIDQIYDFKIPSLVNYVPNTKYDVLIDKMNKIDDVIIKKISDIKYDPTKYDEDRFLLYMNDSNKVYINLPKFKNLNKYDEMVTKFEGKVGTLYLDSGNYFEINK